ncbi:YjgF-like protein [Atractiella rhizophila]|nr:YjgF-like protein [Atractiella rhizophila]
MSQLSYFNHSIGEKLGSLHHYSAAVRLPGGIVKLSGQVGMSASGESSSDLVEQAEKAFENVEEALKAAGLQGWENVYSVRIYLVGEKMEERAAEACVKLLRRYCPQHRPLLTVVGVAALFGGLKIEVEVEAHDGN